MKFTNTTQNGRSFGPSLPIKLQSLGVSVQRNILSPAEYDVGSLPSDIGKIGRYSETCYMHLHRYASQKLEAK